ncbi:MAG: nucleotidyltransferase domain-containing protein [Deltaproteobacteria bacterium]|nr:nucleotidyltransferase domain-containing protein [Deltaproteobacteria bacterium]
MLITNEDLTNRIINSVKRNLPYEHFRVFYFGSRASGKATSRSDLDIGIESDSSVPFGVMAKIRGELEEIPILQKLDVVDFSRVPKDFAIEARKNMETIYEQ